MIIVSSKPSQFFTSETDAGGSCDAAALAESIPAYSIEDLFADAEVCRRVGRIISKSAEKRAALQRPAARTRWNGSAE
jgi:hypothetical protein